MSSAPTRYRSIDAWRGLAALAVVVFHCGNVIVDAESVLGRALLSGWLGVFLFFPISGYCILAALHSPENHTVRAFLTRRWWRIIPPYWASILLAVAIGLTALPFNGGSLNDFAQSGLDWLSIATLTQVFTSPPHPINPVYWSLCYEEQFYLVMALALVVPARRRAPMLAALTAAAAVYTSPGWAWRIDGLFLEFWMCFATGCAAYFWLHDRPARPWAAAIFGLAGMMGLAAANIALLVSVATAIALTMLARFDDALTRLRPVATLMAVGTFSFSLYLIHVPIGGRVTNLLHRLGLPIGLTIAASIAASVAAGWLFYVAIENRTLRSRSRSGRLEMPAPAGARAANAAAVAS